MNAKHTPGPWKMNTLLQPSENHRGWGIYWKGGQPRAFGGRIADVFPDCDSRGDPSEEAQANAHLIAASPMTLEALKTALRTLENLNNKVSYETWKNLYEPVRQIRDAIAKAEGKEGMP